MYTKIEGYPDLVKDGTTGAVLSNNNSAYNAVRKRHKAKQLEHMILRPPADRPTND